MAWVLVLGWAGANAGPLADGPAIALIMDDMGNQLDGGLAALQLPGALTFSFLPHTPHAATLAQRAHALGQEVMLHLPMDSQAGKSLGPGALTADMGEAELQATLRNNLAAVPHVRGVNNHMGSLLTRQPQAMQWLMAGLRQYGDLYFVDSRTTPRTVAGPTAAAYLVPTARRDLFLDNDRDPAMIHRQFKRLVSLARRKGATIGIAHPYPETLAVLSEELVALPATGVRQVTVSRLIQIQAGGKRLWQASSSPSPKVAKNSKPSPSSICCAEPESLW